MSAGGILMAAVAAVGAIHGATWVYTAANSPTDDAALAYGLDGTDAVEAILRCRPGSGRIVISTLAAAAPQGVSVQLRSGSATSRHRGHVEPNEAAEGDLIYLIQSVTPARDAALQAFRRGGRLSITTGRNRTDLPAAPRAPRARFFQACAG